MIIALHNCFNHDISFVYIVNVAISLSLAMADVLGLPVRHEFRAYNIHVSVVSSFSGVI